jgi:hypothetical protein
LAECVLQKTSCIFRSSWADTCIYGLVSGERIWPLDLCDHFCRIYYNEVLLNLPTVIKIKKASRTFLWTASELGHTEEFWSCLHLIQRSRGLVCNSFCPTTTSSGSSPFWEVKSIGIGKGAQVPICRPPSPLHTSLMCLGSEIASFH